MSKYKNKIKELEDIIAKSEQINLLQQRELHEKVTKYEIALKQILRFLGYNREVIVKIIENNETPNAVYFLQVNKTISKICEDLKLNA